MVFVLSGSVSGVVSLFWGCFFLIPLGHGLVSFIHFGSNFSLVCRLPRFVSTTRSECYEERLGMTGGLPFGFLFWCTIRMFGGLLLGLL